MNVIPLTTDPDNVDSPKGAVPVSLFGGDGGGEVTWADVSGKPTTFPPATHNQAISTITGLQAALDAITDRLDALEV